MGRLDSFNHPERQRSFMAGRWLARCVVAEHRGLTDPALIPLEIDAQGRSRAPPGPLLWLSISHSQDWVACAMSDAPVGIDIECLRPRNDLPTLAATINSPVRCEELARLPEEAQWTRFYQWWTLKEAWLKRQGLSLDLARMKVHEPVEAGNDAAQALSGVDQQNGLILALDGSGLESMVWPAGVTGVQRWRYPLESAGESI